MVTIVRLTTLSASVAANQVRSVEPPHTDPRVLEAGRPCRANIRRVDRDEMHVGAKPPGQALAAVVAGIEHDDVSTGTGRRRDGGRQREQAARQTLESLCAGTTTTAWSSPSCLLISQFAIFTPGTMEGMTRVQAVLFDYSGTLFRLEEDESWFEGITGR